MLHLLLFLLKTHRYGVTLDRVPFYIVLLVARANLPLVLMVGGIPPPLVACVGLLKKVLSLQWLWTPPFVYLIVVPNVWHLTERALVTRPVPLAQLGVRHREETTTTTRLDTIVGLVKSDSYREDDTLPYCPVFPT